MSANWRLHCRCCVIRFQIDLLQAGFLLSMVQLAGMSLGLLIGLSVDGLGLRRSMLAGLLLQMGASTLGVFAQSAVSLLVLRALEGLGFLWVVMPAPGIIRQMVSPMHLSRMLGIWGAYMPAGTAIALLIGPLWITLPGPLGGWSGWWLLLSTLSLVAAGFVWRGIPSDGIRASRHAVVLPHDVVQPERATWQSRLRLTLGSRGPWLVALCFAMYARSVAGCSGLFAQHLRPVRRGCGLGWRDVGGRCRGQCAWQCCIRSTFAAWLAACPTAANWLYRDGPGCHPLLCRNWRWRATSCCAALWGCTRFFSRGWADSRYPFHASVRLAPSDATVSTTVGFMQQLSAMGQFAGPPMVAMVAQMTGGWGWTWLVTCASSIGGLVLVQWVRRSLESKAHIDEPTHT